VGHVHPAPGKGWTQQHSGSHEATFVAAWIRASDTRGFRYTQAAKLHMARVSESGIHHLQEDYFVMNIVIGNSKLC
jgi:hypothetical protein